MAPPVKKSEVIEALYLLAFEKFTAEEKEKATRRAELIAQWEDALKPLLAKPRSIAWGRPNCWDKHDIKVEVTLTLPLKEIGKQFYKCAAVAWNEKEERKRIAESMSAAGGRAKDLLTDPTSRAALEQMLAQING